MSAPLESPPTTRESSEAAWRPAPPPKPAADATEEALYEVRRKIYPRSVTGAFSSWR
ncbi:cytochrome c oxidase accessory protein CcoG, partial [Cupriavidus sp. CER94]